jgi:hypothetical protein
MHSRQREPCISEHKFHVGQLVEFRPIKRSRPVGAYEILKQLPERDGELRYRIRSQSKSTSVLLLRAN